MGAAGLLKVRMRRQNAPISDGPLFVFRRREGRRVLHPGETRTSTRRCGCGRSVSEAYSFCPFGLQARVGFFFAVTGCGPIAGWALVSFPEVGLETPVFRNGTFRETE